MDARRFTQAELEALNTELLKPLEGRGAAVALQVLLAGVIAAIDEMEKADDTLPGDLLALRATAKIVYGPLVVALREGPYDGLTVA